MRRLGIILVKFYKRLISPSLKSRCIYTPGCSIYMLQAIEKHGFLKGCALGAARLLRCLPWKEGGFDPVPENYRGKLKWII
ncbi:MAG TPA: membrane protein insertion efficiency factor YidD [Eubacteriales bacterium]|jgi:putative membrane protein insertion efficiency factor|nr:membrane protein insertion efficiency factor YidD [Clostridia bacterium]HRR89630.1 membrane protein insertion efficiency factor YidD [Eubacteriales bacterium]HRU84038.1 membrane protein insertion efficiency factor YidD [Eubacteriales bacterium]